MNEENDLDLIKNKKMSILNVSNNAAHIFAYFGLATFASLAIYLYITGMGFDYSTSIIEKIFIFSPFALAVFFIFRRLWLKRRGGQEGDKKTPDLIDKILSYIILISLILLCYFIVMGYLSSL